MIRKSLNDILLGDLQSLIAYNVQERKTLEYKAILPSNSDADKKEFLADISSLANTEGGDLIFGIGESDGQLLPDIGIEIANTDAEIARLENILREGISPRINVDIRSIPCEGSRSAIILRAKPSLEMPHRVVFKSHDKFYRRNSNGKYPMDVSELRASFLQSGDLVEKIRRFRTVRVADIKANDTPLPIQDPSHFFAIHIVPLSAFSVAEEIGPIADAMLAKARAGDTKAIQMLLDRAWGKPRQELKLIAQSQPVEISPRIQELARRLNQEYRKEFLTTPGAPPPKSTGLLAE